MHVAVAVVLLLVLAGGGGGGLAPLAARADVFCDNLKLLSASVPGNTSSSPQHFATAAAGRAPDVVYVLAFCRGDVANGSACGDCVADTLGSKLYGEACVAGRFRAGTYYGERCTVGYSDEDSVVLPYNATADSSDPPFERWNIKSIPGDADVVRLIAGLIHDLLAETVRTAADAATRFGTGSADSGGTFPMVYSVAQCTPDMSAADCSACLRRLTGMINSTDALRVGGQMHVLRCFFRYEATKFYDGEPMVRLGAAAPPPVTPLAPTKAKQKGNMNKLWVIPIVVVPVVVASLCFIFYYPWLRRYRGKLGRRSKNLQGDWSMEGKNSEFSVFDFDEIVNITSDFSEECKLREGVFGAVYKGRFSDGLEVAVKRLASYSGQGFMEFRNEIQLIAKLQHRNLVRLLGCSTQGEEKILVYEYLPNKSLDLYIFDENNGPLLDWRTRLAIIEGIAHGLLYLHKHSRLSVIHRDLKPSNILLDSEMNPKISDFGLARIFSSDNTQGNITRRVVGTYGYMAPEYSSIGHFSVKSDVFSFGVVVLEILSGKRNSGSHQHGDFINLLGYAWQVWQQGRWLELMDPALISSAHSEEEMRMCVNIALLCVQDNAADRPTMSDVVAMLSNRTMIMSDPKHPGYFHVRVGHEEASTVTDSTSSITISVPSAR